MYVKSKNSQSSIVFNTALQNSIRMNERNGWVRKEENMYTKSTFHGSDAEIKFITTYIKTFVVFPEECLLKSLKKLLK